MSLSRLYKLVNFSPKQVLPLSQFLLLQTASRDAIVCLKNTNLEGREAIEEMYFKKLYLHSIEEFLTYQLKQCKGKGGLQIQVTMGAPFGNDILCTDKTMPFFR